jgi:hypothetical protein
MEDNIFLSTSLYFERGIVVMVNHALQGVYHVSIYHGLHDISNLSGFFSYFDSCFWSYGMMFS